MPLLTLLPFTQLVGLKCGGQALNLTMANRVIIVDPWWNAVAEDQAYGRVRRIGQTKETHLVRLFSDTPVDRRIRQLQSDKSAEVSRALQDDRHEPVPLDDEALEGLFTGMSTKKAGKQKAT